MSILSTFYCPDIVTKDEYSISESGDYVIDGRVSFVLRCLGKFLFDFLSNFVLMYTSVKPLGLLLTKCFV